MVNESREERIKSELQNDEREGEETTCNRTRRKTLKNGKRHHYCDDYLCRVTIICRNDQLVSLELAANKKVSK